MLPWQFMTVVAEWYWRKFQAARMMKEVNCKTDALVEVYMEEPGPTL